MTLNAQAVFAAVFSLVLSAAVFTSAAPVESVMTGVSSLSASMSLINMPDRTFTIKVSDLAFDAANDAKCLEVLPKGASAPSLIAKVEVEGKNMDKAVIQSGGLDYVIRESCSAKALLDVNSRPDTKTWGNDWTEYATGDLSINYGPLSLTKFKADMNVVILREQVNNDKILQSCVIMDPTLLASQLCNKYIVVMDVNNKQYGCVALNP
ncbi:hypothetical protein AMAG_05924 [Allomyces macrogynus ATCC 38327]|uniref:Uncharacterized protein n=1 Tax=Allomyces macrogynus (strain ATCC 38327) TaxID=578462 RepID=A0A0L0SDP1_ALLM3|nr:hypothetical protein AMAG_05924 [Allomyces macrogynus ATCC 38327]|eukprot:KNE60544.1 hypothetical protein AMAG_05924 [Allomyces macrogynus ATCC 38327]